MKMIVMAGLLSGKSGLIVTLGIVTAVMIAFLMLILRLRTTVIGSIDEAMTKAVDRFIAPAGGGSMSASGSGSITGGGSSGSGGGGGGAGVMSAVGRTALMTGTSGLVGGAVNSVFGGGDVHASVATGSDGADGEDGANGVNGTSAGAAGSNGTAGADGSSSSSAASSNSTGKDGTGEKGASGDSEATAGAESNATEEGQKAGQTERTSASDSVSSNNSAYSDRKSASRDSADKAAANQVLMTSSLQEYSQLSGNKGVSGSDASASAVATGSGEKAGNASAVAASTGNAVNAGNASSQASSVEKRNVVVDGKGASQVSVATGAGSVGQSGAANASAYAAGGSATGGVNSSSVKGVQGSNVSPVVNGGTMNASSAAYAANGNGAVGNNEIKGVVVPAGQSNVNANAAAVGGTGVGGAGGGSYAYGGQGGGSYAAGGNAVGGNAVGGKAVGGNAVGGNAVGGQGIGVNGAPGARGATMYAAAAARDNAHSVHVQAPGMDVHQAGGNVSANLTAQGGQANNMSLVHQMHNVAAQSRDMSSHNMTQMGGNVTQSQQMALNRHMYSGSERVAGGGGMAMPNRSDMSHRGGAGGTMPIRVPGQAGGGRAVGSGAAGQPSYVPNASGRVPGANGGGGQGMYRYSNTQYNMNSRGAGGQQQSGNGRTPNVNMYQSNAYNQMQNNVTQGGGANRAGQYDRSRSGARTQQQQQQQYQPGQRQRYDPSVENAQHGVSGNPLGNASSGSRSHSGGQWSSRSASTAHAQGQLSNRGRANLKSV